MKTISRRSFMTATTTLGAAAATRPRGLGAGNEKTTSPDVSTPASKKPALLGGSPVREAEFPSWPVVDQREEKALLDALHSGHWYRGDGEAVKRFEKAYAELTGARNCIATANGTSALLSSLAALDVGPGHEVILPPYTFVATVNVIFMQYALPIFVDTDIETQQIDATKIDAAVTDRTGAIVPVHLGGNAADLDTVLEVSRKREVPVVEDACQAVLGEWRNRKLGTWGEAGCFSFQASKNLASGEGGAILTNDDEVADRAYAFHDHSRPRRRGGTALGSARSANLRLTEFQGNLLLAQMTRLESQSKRREENARYLSSQLAEIPGITPARMYEGCTRNGYHIYMTRYDAEGFAGLPRGRFMEAMRAEGIPCAGGYRPLNTHPTLKATVESPAYKRIFPPEVLADWAERTRCPVNDRLCDEAVWFGQTTLLGPRQDMDDIAAAIRKIQASAAELKS